MNISLTNTRVESLTFDMDDDIDSDKLSLSFQNGFLDDDSNSFEVKFKLDIESAMNYRISLSYIAEFETDEVIDQPFKESHFPIINAPAIAYPFMRSYIATIILNSGYEPLILPTINFQAMAQDKMPQVISK